MTDDSKVLLDKNKPAEDNKDTKNSSSGGDFHTGVSIKKKLPQYSSFCTKLMWLDNMVLKDMQ